MDTSHKEAHIQTRLTRSYQRDVNAKKWNSDRGAQLAVGAREKKQRKDA